SLATTRIELHDRLELDDHDSPAVLVRPDGRYLAAYARHGTDHLVRWRISAAGNPTRWEPERTFAIDAESRTGVTYSNVFHLPGATGGRGLALNVYRGEGWDPNVLISDDLGTTWRQAGRLLAGPGRPYLKYASNGRDELHFIATEQHPRDFDNSVYHGILRDGHILRSDGSEAGTLGAGAPAPEALTRVLAGRPDRVAWTVDLEVDALGRPYAAISVQRDGEGLPQGQGGDDHRYHYARWDGRAWRCFELARAGRRLYAGEDDYTGLVALDPDDPDTAYVSTDVHPADGRPLVSAADGRRHHEIFRGRTTDGGASWSWTAVTRDSTADNVRPVVPAWSARRTALLWLRGEYRTYTDFDLDVVLLLVDGDDGATHDERP
ncbi:MAG: BNR-4 repeat-containing protein, partial [Planctomycetota bacterium]